ncbi:trigger factor [Alsobacter metallidurans]|uniref:Trigger factor n=1 Tax=Alsobacter metallidurans TaxID=340221 RepID=A0A917I830_9HYPH|nr:trigger factor [Alsobacter metallidurans]GGH21214.1 trigger factor [Alsobacter metallidurans]
MQVTETLSEGLKREFTVVLPAKDLEERLTNELVGMKDKVRINGFRPGKVPVGHLRRVYGRSVMADVLQNLVNETNRKIVEDQGLKLALEPQIVFPENKEEVEAAMEAKGDLSYKVALEVLPKFEIADFSGLAVTREVFDVPESELSEALDRLAQQNRQFATKGEGAKAEKGDRVVVDFVGSIDGTEFEGGAGTDIPVDIGSNGFIPGFEDQLIGATAGQQLTILATFPAEYGAPQLAGKEASFATTVKDVQAPSEVTIDDEFAKQFGMDDLAALKTALGEAIAKDYTAVSRRKLKRQLLDALDGQYTFDLPPSLMTQEFDNIWRQVESDMQQSGKTFADEETTEEEARAEYQKIAARRVRLGLVLAEIGEKAQVQVTDDEVSGALVERARQFPGQERMVWDFYRKNPQALAEIRAPIFEEKVIDHILETANVTEKKVTKEELMAEDEEGKPSAAAASEDKPKKARASKKKAGAEPAAETPVTNASE